jgi:hypothetical protein
LSEESWQAYLFHEATELTLLRPQAHLADCQSPRAELHKLQDCRVRYQRPNGAGSGENTLWERLQSGATENPPPPPPPPPPLDALIACLQALGLVDAAHAALTKTAEREEVVDFTAGW